MNIYTDKQGNIVPDCCPSEALAKGYNVNCTDCMGCVDCVNCKYCSNCTGCSNCNYCKDCTDCNYCIDCRKSNSLHICQICNNCNDCMYGRYLDNCNKCNYCNDCLNCTSCNNCTKCNNCDTQPLANITTDIWTICVTTKGQVSIGCQSHPIKEWLRFDDRTIRRMSFHATKFWTKWKPVIAALEPLVIYHPDSPTPDMRTSNI